VDFTKWSSNCARLQKFQIVEVKPPRLGDTHPSAVHANLTFTLKDHDNNQTAKQAWLQEISVEGSVIYLIGFEKDRESKHEGFDSEFGVKLVRGVTVQGRVVHTDDSKLHAPLISSNEEEPDSYTL
jgi:hypothetical protein